MFKEVVYDLHVVERSFFSVRKSYLTHEQHRTTVETLIQYSVIKGN